MYYKMPLPNNVSSMLEQLSKLPQRKITQIVIFLLLSYIAYLFAQITWLAAPQHNRAKLPINGAASASATLSKKINIEAIKTLNLFGDFHQKIEEKIEEVIIEDAPETRLKLTLTGVVASTNKDTAAAIIESSGKQETYGVGENIKGTRAVLENVFNDRVLLKVSGTLETLMLDGIDFNNNAKSIKPTRKSTRQTANGPFKKSPSKTHLATNRVDQRKNKALIKSAQKLKKTLNADPGKITDYLRYSPNRENSKITGFKLRPGKDPTFFKNAGLKTGDIAIQMNGYDLTAPREAAEALQSLKTQQEVSLLIDRNGDITEILFSIKN